MARPPIRVRGADAAELDDCDLVGAGLRVGVRGRGAGPGRAVAELPEVACDGVAADAGQAREGRLQAVIVSLKPGTKPLWPVSMIPPKPADKPLVWNTASPTAYTPATGKRARSSDRRLDRVITRCRASGVESLYCQLKSAIDGPDPLR